MKIAFFVGVFPKLSETFILNQITGLIDRGHEVDIYAFAKEEVEIEHGPANRFDMVKRTTYLTSPPPSYLKRSLRVLSRVPTGIFRIPGPTLRSLDFRRFGRAALGLRLLDSTLDLFRPRRYDILHCQFADLAPLVSRLREVGILSGRLVVSFRGYDVTKVPSLRPGIYDGTFRDVELFLPVCEFLRSRVVAMGAPTDRIRVLHSGIDCSKFPFRDRTIQEGEPIRLLSVARLVEKKGIQVGLQAVGLLKREGRRLSYRIIGDGPWRDRLRREIVQRGLEEDVHLLGWCDSERIREELDKAHVFLAPSLTARDGDQEGIPNSLKEAMAAGVPVVASRHSGIPEAVEHGHSGILVEEGDAEALATGIRTLADDPTLARRLARTARLKVEETFDTERLVERLLNLYTEVLNGSTRLSAAERTNRTTSESSAS